MQYYSCGILYVIVGCEMIYILRQRLIAQEIEKSTSRKVLNDIITSMFNSTHFNTVFKRQCPFTLREIEETFTKLAHSSVMKLNRSSMLKLLDLMTAGAKFQVLNARSPREYLTICTTHIKVVSQYVNKSTRQLLRNVTEELEATYGTLGSAKFLDLKRGLYDFFSDNHVRISVLTRQKLQLQDGLMKIDLGECCPPEILPPGKLKIYDSLGSIASVKQLPLAVTQLALREYHSGINDTISKLGENLYVKPEYEVRGPEVPSEGKSDSDFDSDEEKHEPSRDLDALADFICEDSCAEKSFKLSLFDEGEDEQVNQDKQDEEIIIDSRGETKTMDKRIEELGFNDFVCSKEQDSDDEEDFLEMMDNACTQ